MGLGEHGGAAGFFDPLPTFLAKAVAAKRSIAKLPNDGVYGFIKYVRTQTKCYADGSRVPTRDVIPRAGRIHAEIGVMKPSSGWFYLLIHRPKDV